MLDEKLIEENRFTKNKFGVVFDSETNLEWLVGPDEDTTWDEAKAWVESLGGDWRMPTKGELIDIFQKGKTSSHNMSPLLKTTGWEVWTRVIKGPSSAWYLDFGYGSARYFWRDYSDECRGFAVRFQKTKERKLVFRTLDGEIFEL